VHALGPGGDAAGFHDVQEELEIGQVEAHSVPGEKNRGNSAVQHYIARVCWHGAQPTRAAARCCTAEFPQFSSPGT
jgi:hypothetical protein